VGNLVIVKEMFSPFLKGVKITTRLIIKKNGKVIVDKEIDLVTRWFERIFNAYLGAFLRVSDLYGSGPIIAEDGIGYDTYVNNIAVYYDYCPFRYHHDPSYIKIAIGSGAPTPTLDSYALAVKEYEATNPSRATFEYYDGRWETILAYTFTIDKTVTIQEAGIFHMIWDTAAKPKWVLLSLDTFTPQELVAGDTLTVEYRQRVEA